MVADKAAAELIAEYFGQRLKDTLQFTQQSTRLIYIVSGAVLAFIYFLLKEVPFGGRPQIVALLLFCVAGINFVHAGFLLRQGKWYVDLDKAYATSIGAHRVPSDTGWKMILGSHSLYALIHCVVGGCMVVAAVWWPFNGI